MLGKYESNIITKIIDKVVEALQHRDFRHDYLVGIDSRLEELESLIGTGFDDVRMVGVCGIGGIGKTAIGKVIYNLISYQFDCVSFLANVCKQSMPEVQKELLSHITGLFYKGLTVDEGINEIKNKLRQKKVLMVVDDVDSLTQLKYLVPNQDWLGEEREFVSRILDGAEQAITDLYNKSLLTFSNNKILMHPLLQQMGQEVVHQPCPQEPGKQSRLWRSEDVHRILRQNEGTDAIEGIFLDTSAAEPIEFTTEAFKMMNKLRLLKGIFLDTSPAEPIEFTTEAFKMMNKLRLLKVCRGHKCGSMVKNYEVHVSTDFEFPSSELRYLYWDEYPLESLPTNFHGEKLIELNLQNSKLRRLWEGSKPLEKLKVINLSHSQQLIQIPDFSDTPNLESLILEGGCTNLEKIPSSIWDLDSLVNLDLSHCSKLQELAEIPWNLYSLEYLNLESCKNLKSLPESLCNLKCLKILNVIGCSKLPDNLGNLECLEKLYASSSELISPQSDSSLAEKEIPDDICCLYSLRVLDLSGNLFLRVTDAISQLSKLRELGLRHCKSLLEIPELPSSLRVLDTHDCTGMKTLSSTSVLQWQRHCFKSAFLQEIQELKYRRLLSLPANGVSQGFSTVIPGSGELPEWISHQSIGSEGEPMDKSMDEPESSTSENATVNITQPYHLGCELTFLDGEIGFLDYLSCGSSCQCDHNDGVSESVWVTYYSNVAIKHRYRSDKPRHLMASFRGHVNGKPVKVNKCGIGLVDVDHNPLKLWDDLPIL
ncbi:Disease resistance-like protein CSA1 [Vitis vinifera]|uniref:Disease resistance-like protein CSA1 n=1 Tax=Vitis vinifera TaxID=29760 RepID=A0A438FVS0_VITVI|nr:Disease resistance-like protein CSA1 [Vitis vinifera]